MNDRLTKAQLYKIVSEAIGVPNNEAKVIINIILGKISEALDKDEKVSLQKFGTFSVVPPKNRRIYNLKSKHVETVNIRSTVSFKASRALVSTLNKKQLKHKQAKLFVDSEDCRVIQSIPNKNQTDSLRIGYDPTVIAANEKQYPIVLLPKKNAFLKLPRDGRSDIRGFKENVFLQSLHEANLGIEINNELHLAIPGRTSPYEPDFVLFSPLINLYIDVEIDEPYDGYYRTPTHTKEGRDDTRNLFFIESGWIVVRFTEKQIHTDVYGCTETLRSIIESIKTNASHDYIKTKEIENRWDIKQALKWEKDLYREKYLGIQAFEKQERHQKVICDTYQERIDLKIKRTQKHSSDGKTIDVSNKTNLTRRLLFDETVHSYYGEQDLSGNSDFVSVTTLIDQLFPTFDEESYIKKRVSETGKSEEEIRKELREPSERGTYLHSQIEAFLYGKEYDDSITEFQLFEEFYEQSIKPKNLKFIDAEKTIILPQHNIAGTVDAIFQKENGDYIMVDWKRSKHLIIDGYPKKYGYGRGFSFLSHLDNSSYYKYELQQSFYRYILEKEYGIHIATMLLVVLHPDYQKYYVIKLLEYREKEVKQLIEYNDIKNK